ncbi:hypothetical protein M413DRAFT_49185, partial [Hebeloma cylindrosporum]
SNIAVLTRAHSVVAAKKRAKREQIKEVIFDDVARRHLFCSLEFLTGFHKRKVAKADAARAKAKEREKQERLEARREQRSMLRERALQNAAQVEQAYGAILGNAEDEEEWAGIDQRRDEEYEDEEILATVTVVEDFDPDSIIHGPPKTDLPAASSQSRSEPKSSQPPPQTKPLQKPTKHKKPRDKKIRYETKDARKREQTKQRARRTEKAELAGGKASRKSTHGARR